MVRTFDDCKKIATAVIIQAIQDIKSPSADISNRAKMDVRLGGLTPYLKILGIKMSNTDFLKFAINTDKINKFSGRKDVANEG